MFLGLSLSPVVDRYVCLYRVSLWLVQYLSAGTCLDPVRGYALGYTRVQCHTRVVYPGGIEGSTVVLVAIRVCLDRVIPYRTRVCLDRVIPYQLLIWF